MKPAPILFVTGTDTGVGKSTVSALLVSALKKTGRKIVPVKPVETGCSRGPDGELSPQDAELLSAAADEPARVYYRYELPVAPQVAAEKNGEPIDPALIAEKILRERDGCDLVLVEGAGGLLVPIASGFSFADLAKLIDAHTLVVVGSRLGALNHSALTFEVLRARALPALGYVINDISPDADDAQQTNPKLLREIGKGYALNELSAIPFFDCRKDLSDLFRFSESPSIRQLCSAVIDYFELG